MFLRHIRIENVRAIAQSELDLQGEDGDVRKWTLLLGENGTGKSTLLRCMALLLCGRDALPELLGRDPSNWIRSGQASARIEGVVATSAGDESTVRLDLRARDTISTTLDRNASQLAPFEAPDAQTDRDYFLAGYGASRRLGRPGLGRDSSRSGRAGMLRTLFDADATLRPLASWAMDQHYVGGDEALARIRSALGELLPDVTFRGIDKQRKTLTFDTVDGPVALEDLSDGYQNVAAWVGDLLSCTTTAFGNHAKPLQSRGLLLIDELDLHLHVRWQRLLRRFLEEKLPRFQIVATTHSPMTAQQAGPGELHVFARPTPEAPPALRSYEGAPDRLGLHQVVQPFFNVDTVDSARIARLKDEYRALTAKRPKSADDKKRLKGLRDELADAPAWHDGPEAKAQTKALRSIQDLLERSAGGSRTIPYDEPQAKSRRRPVRGRRAKDVTVGSRTRAKNRGGD